MGRRKVITTIYIEPEQDLRLKALSSRTRVPVSEFIRQGIDLVLALREPDDSADFAGVASERPHP